MTDPDIIREAMRLLGSVRSERKKAAARLRMANVSEEYRAKLRLAQQRRRQAERERRIDAPTSHDVV